MSSEISSQDGLGELDDTALLTKEWCQELRGKVGAALNLVYGAARGHGAFTKVGETPQYVVVGEEADEAWMQLSRHMLAADDLIRRLSERITCYYTGVHSHLQTFEEPCNCGNCKLVAEARGIEADHA